MLVRDFIELVTDSEFNSIRMYDVEKCEDIFEGYVSGLSYKILNATICSWDIENTLCLNIEF